LGLQYLSVSHFFEFWNGPDQFGQLISNLCVVRKICFFNWYSM
jgi:hypothetical protein